GRGRPGVPNERGDFTITDVMAGHYVVRGNAPRGWMMKSVYVNGIDATDQPIEVKTEAVSGLNVIYTDRIGGVSGTVHDARGAGAQGLTVILFPSDEKFWIPQSRFIQ